MSEQAITQNKKGQFLPGNIWRYKPGQSGHPARYNYKSMRLKVIEFVEQQHEHDKAITWAGLAFYLGMSRNGLDRYRHGDIKKDSTAIVGLLSYYETAIEAQREAMMTDRQYATAGVIKGLQAIDRDKWGDKTEVSHDIKQQISVIVQPGSALAERMDKAGVTLEQPLDALDKPK